MMLCMASKSFAPSLIVALFFARCGWYCCCCVVFDNDDAAAADGAGGGGGGIGGD